jgi:hypothetical protein
VIGAIAWPNDERNHCGEKRKEDYDQNGFHTSSLWGSVGAAISSVLVIRVERLLPRAELAHFAERHGLDRLVEAGACQGLTSVD